MERRSALRLPRRRHRLGEFELIGKLIEHWYSGPDVLIGPGDDASAVRWAAAGVVLLQTTDLLIENVHFRRDWGTPRQLGWKALAVNLSDIAAMGGKPLHAHLNLAIPTSWPQKEILSFQSGFRALAERFGVSLLGGDLSSSPGPLVISVMVNGCVKAGKAIRRSGAIPGDVIWVSGTLGDAAAGLRLLQSAQRSARFSRHERALQKAFLQPMPEVDLGIICSDSGCVHAMIDLSDGLAGDLGHILELSKVGAIIESDKLPISKALSGAAKRHRWKVQELTLQGGEDYRLLGYSPPNAFKRLNQRVEKELNRSLFPIGEMTAQRGLFLRQQKGRVLKLKAKSFDHFSST